MTSGRTAKRQFWSNHLQSAEQPEESLASYAGRNNIMPQKLYRWRSVFKQQTQTSISTETVFTKVVVFPDQAPLP